MSIGTLRPFEEQKKKTRKNIPKKWIKLSREIDKKYCKILETSLNVKLTWYAFLEKWLEDVNIFKKNKNKNKIK